MKSMKSMNSVKGLSASKGWHNEYMRHSLARKGVKTGEKVKLTRNIYFDNDENMLTENKTDNSELYLKKGTVMKKVDKETYVGGYHQTSLDKKWYKKYNELPKTNIDIVREKRYGKKGFNVVVWDYIGGNFHPRAGWIEYGSLEKLYPKSRYNYRYLDKPDNKYRIQSIL